MPQPMTRTTIWLPKEDLEEAKLKAEERDESLSSLIRKLLRKLPKKA